MGTTEMPPVEGEIAILVRVLGDEEGRFSDDLARYILGVRFNERDLARMHDLAVRNQEDTLSAVEKDELLAFVNAGDLLAILKSKACGTLGGRLRERPAT